MYSRVRSKSGVRLPNFTRPLQQKMLIEMQVCSHRSVTCWPPLPLSRWERIEGEGPYSARGRARDSRFRFSACLVFLSETAKPSGKYAVVRSISRNRPQIAPRANPRGANSMASSARQTHVQREIPSPASHRPLLRRFLLASTKSSHRARWWTARRPVRRRSGSQRPSQIARISRASILE
jgi:hypothetical protein